MTSFVQTAAWKIDIFDNLSKIPWERFVKNIFNEQISFFSDQYNAWNTSRFQKWQSYLSFTFKFSVSIRSTEVSCTLSLKQETNHN